MLDKDAFNLSQGIATGSRPLAIAMIVMAVILVAVVIWELI